MAETVEAREFTAEGRATSASTQSCSCTSSFSLESLRMMTLPSPNGPRSPRLRSPKSLLVSSSSYEVSGKSSSSSEERSTTGMPSEGPPCSRTGQGSLRADTSGGDIGNDRDSDGDGGGIEESLDEDEEPLAEERERLVPLLSSIVNMWREGEKNLGEKVKNCKMDCDA
jgi:hypothetical protein